MRDPNTKCKHADKDKFNWTIDCPNMKEKEGDTSMDYEHYECKVCGEFTKLDYEEMK